MAQLLVIALPVELLTERGMNGGQELPAAQVPVDQPLSTACGGFADARCKTIKTLTCLKEVRRMLL